MKTNSNVPGYYTRTPYSLCARTKKRVPKLRNCYEYNSKYVRHTAGEQTLVESHIVLSYVHCLFFFPSALLSFSFSFSLAISTTTTSGAAAATAAVATAFHCRHIMEIYDDVYIVYLLEPYAHANYVNCQTLC